MKKYPLGKNSYRKNYIDEQELFILFSLMTRKYFSSLDEVCTPIIKKNVYTTEAGERKKIQAIEKEINELYKSNQSKLNSPIIALYLLELGRELDEKNFSINCNADYSLLDGGFLYESDNYSLMMEYLRYILGNKKQSANKFKTLTNKQKKAVGACILEENKRNGKIIFPSSEAYRPIKEYRETILDKKGDDDFIVLVNKLIRDGDDKGSWDKDDLTKFIEIYRRHNSKIRTIDNFFYKDTQTKLSELIFRHANIVLKIKDTKKLERDFSEYIDLFINDKLNGFCRNDGLGLTCGFFRSSLLVPHKRVMFGFQRQKEILLKHISDEYEQYKRSDLEIISPFFEPRCINDGYESKIKITFSQIDKEEELFLFVHTMIALAKSKYFKITDDSYGQTEMFDELDRGFLFKITVGDFFKKNNKLEKGAISEIIPVKLIESDTLRVKLENFLLTLNKNTGSICLNNFKGSLNPASQEFEILLKLMTGKDYQATYQNLLGESVSKLNKRNLSFTIRNLKKALGILPAKKAKNKNCIKNIKLYGYRLTV